MHNTSHNRDIGWALSKYFHEPKNARKNNQLSATERNCGGGNWTDKLNRLKIIDHKKKKYFISFYSET